MFHYQDTVELNKQGVKVDVSTVELPNGYETCLFFPNGDSDVVQTYGGLIAAKRGHQEWVDADRIDEAWARYINNRHDALYRR